MNNRSQEVIISIANALIAAIPIIGGSTNSLIGDYQTGRKLKRLEEFYNSLKAELEANTRLLQSDYLKEEDFLDLFEETARRIVHERNNTKREAYKNIFVNSIKTSKNDYDKTEDFIQVLGRLREGHVFILKILDDPVSFDRENGNRVGLGGGLSTSFNNIFRKLLPDWEEEEVLVILSELESERMVENLFRSYKAMITDRGIRHLEGRITERGKEFIKFIRND